MLDAQASWFELDFKTLGWFEEKGAGGYEAGIPVKEGPHFWRASLKSGSGKPIAEVAPFVARIYGDPVEEWLCYPAPCEEEYKVKEPVTKAKNSAFWSSHGEINRTPIKVPLIQIREKVEITDPGPFR